MRQNLIEFIKEKENFLKNGDILCYWSEGCHTEVGSLVCAIYLDSFKDKYIVYNNAFTIDEIDLKNNTYYPLYDKAEIETDNIIVKHTLEDLWELIKQSIRNTLKLDSRYEDLCRESIENSGRLVKNGPPKDEKLYMFVGMSSSDEDYYNILVGMENNQIKVVFATAVARLYFVEEEDYGDEEKELINFINSHRADVEKKVKQYKTDVLLTGINFSKTEHFKVS